MSSKHDESLAGTIRKRRGFARLSIGTRLAICYTLSAFGMLAAVTAFQYRILIQGLEWDEFQIVLDKVKMFESTLRMHGDNQAFLDHEVNLQGGAYWPGQHYVVYSRILDESGRVIIETHDMERLIPDTVFPPPVVASLESGPELARYRQVPDGHTYFLMSAWAQSGDANAPRRLIQVAMDDTGERALIAGYRRDTLLAMFLGTLLFAVAGTFIAHRCLRPVHDLARTAERITANNVMKTNTDAKYSRWPRELSALADSLNRMLFRIERSYNRCAQCAEDLAHEIRNPIHCLMGEAEVALTRDRTPEEYRQILESSLEEYARLTRMVNELLFIARADNPHNAIECAQLDVRSELEAVREFHEVQAQEQAITITCHGQASLDADPLLFRRAISNLLTNAMVHTPAGGKISLAVRTADHDDMIEVTVRDTGCGIETDDLPRVFDRYCRAGQKNVHHREGAGLGLAIVKSIMTLHGGSVAIESTQDTGTTVVLRFPSSPRPVGERSSSISEFMPA